MALVIVHHRSSVQCFFSDNAAVVAAAFPAEAVSDGDVRSEEAYRRVIAGMLGKKMPSPVSAVLVLADDLCYVGRAQAGGESEEVKRLVADTPFTRVETVSIRAPKETYVIATNADMYETAIRAFADMGVSVSLVIPWGALTFLKISAAGEMDKTTARKVSDSASQLKAYSFPVEVHERLPTVPGERVPETKHKKLSTGWMIFGALALAYAVGMVWYMLRQ